MGLGTALVPTKPWFSHQVRSLAFQCGFAEAQETSEVPRKPPREFGEGEGRVQGVPPPQSAIASLLSASYAEVEYETSF